MDGYANDNGLGLSWDDQLRFNRTLADAAHDRGLSIALKNDLEQIPALVEYFDFAVNEQCNECNECDRLQPFQAAGKAILNAEYAAGYHPPSAAFDQLCARSEGLGLSTLVLPRDLDDSFRHSCD